MPRDGSSTGWPTAGRARPRDGRGGRGRRGWRRVRGPRPSPPDWRWRLPHGRCASCSSTPTPSAAASTCCWASRMPPASGGRTWRTPGVASSAASLEQALPHVGGVTVLSAGREGSTALAPESLAAVLDAGERGFDLVVVDLPRQLDPAGEIGAGARGRGPARVRHRVRSTAAAARVAATLQSRCASVGLVAARRPKGRERGRRPRCPVPPDRGATSPYAVARLACGQRRAAVAARCVRARLPGGAAHHGDDTCSRRVSAPLLDRVRSRLVAHEGDATPARVAAALRAEGLVLGDDAILELVRTLRQDLVGAGPLEPLHRRCRGPPTSSSTDPARCGSIAARVSS